MITLFHAPQTRSGRLVWLMEEIGQPYTLHYCPIIRADGSGGRDPGNPHPDGKVPALFHDGVPVSESLAIALYLTELFPEAGLGAPVGSPARGGYLTWLAWTAGELEPALWSMISGSAQGDPRAAARFDAVTARLFEALERGPYLMGETFSAVDVMVASALAWGRAHVPASPLLDAYLGRVVQRPASLRACEKDAMPAALSAA
jgi:glutathione S-transferase